MPQVISRSEARGSVNAIWLLTSAVLLWHIGRELGLGRNLCWLTVALFASFPLTAALMMGMHTEGPSIAIVLAVALIILRSGPEPDAASFRLIAILAGLLLGLKLTNALSLVPLGLWLLIRWRGRLPWPQVPLAVFLLALIALPSLVHAWLLAGNPVLPLFNDIFLSEYARPERFSDQRWSAPVGLDIMWRTSFHVSDYLTARPGAAGFALVTLAGGFPLALARADLRPYLLVALAIFVLPMLAAPYFRYAQPGVVALIPVLVAALCHNRSRYSTGLLAALVVLQIAYQANSLWMLRLGALETRVLQGQNAVLERFVPERLIARQVRVAKPDARIFLAARERPYVAIFAGQAFTWSWYDYQLQQAGRVANTDPRGYAWQQLWADHGLTHVLVAGQVEASIMAAIEDAMLVAEAGDVRLFRLGTASEVDLAARRNKARQPSFLPGPAER